MIRKDREIKSVEDEIYIQHYMLVVSGLLGNSLSMNLSF
jgi:hypothetical protein